MKTIPLEKRTFYYVTNQESPSEAPALIFEAFGQFFKMENCSVGEKITNLVPLNSKFKLTPEFLHDHVSMKIEMIEENVSLTFNVREMRTMN